MTSSSASNPPEKTIPLRDDAEEHHALIEIGT
jgi:hypothetical protein